MSTPWQPPQYEEVRIRPGYTDWLCPRCGGFVHDFIAHNRHHKALDDLKESLLAISQVIVPGLPPGVMLMPEPAVKINVVPADQQATTEEEGAPSGNGSD